MQFAELLYLVIAVSENVKKHYTSIRVTKETVELLKERGRKGDSYDDIIQKLLKRRRR